MMDQHNLVRFDNLLRHLVNFQFTLKVALVIELPSLLFILNQIVELSNQGISAPVYQYI